jgi:hypothetical protein
MITSLYTQETAKWYSLLNQAQVDTCYYLGTDVERYIAEMLFRFSCNAQSMLEYPKGGSSIEWNPAREERLIRVQDAGERCLVTAGFFPEHANYAGLSLLHFIEKGRKAYHDLAEAIPDVNIYSDIDNHFVQVVDVLQRIGELSGVCQPIDLIQACELWQHERSHYGWLVLKGSTDAFPASTASVVTH